jgi:magnesium transporter
VHCLTALDRTAIGQLHARDEFFWLDLVAPPPEELERLRHELQLPEPPHQPEHGRRRLFEDHEEVMVLVCRTADLVDGAVAGYEVIVYVTGDFVVTIHDKPLDELERLRRRLQRSAGQEEEWTVARVLDAVYDPLVEVLDDVDDRIGHLESDVIEHSDPAQLGRIVELRRELLELRRLINPQRDVLLRVADDIADLPGLEAGDRVDIHEVADYLARLGDRIDTYGGLLTNAMDMYLSTSSNRLNEVMGRLTVVATVFLPLTFVTGFFGQNFEFLTNHVKGEYSFIFLGLTLTLASAMGTYVWVKYTERRQLAEAAAAGRSGRRR